MKNTKFSSRILVIVLFALLPSLGQSQIQCLKSFQYSFGGNSDDVAYDVADAGSGQFFTAGTTTSYGAGGLDILITKMSSNGVVLWSNAYGGGADETVRKIKSTLDGGLLVVGQTKSFTYSQGEMFCFKIDATGKLLWSKRFGIGSQFGDLGMDIIQTTDGGFALSGIINVNGKVADLSLIRMDNAANILWSKRFDSNQGENGVGILQRGDTLIVTGDVDNNGSYFNTIVNKIKLSDGSFIAGQKIVPVSRGVFNPYIFDDNGKGYFISEHIIDGASYSAMQPTILKLDNNFNIIKTYSYKVPGVLTNDYYTGFAQMPNGFVACASTTGSATTGYLFYINTDGSVRWSKNFAGKSNRSLYKLQHIGSQIVAVGRDNSSGKGDDFYVAGFNEGGYIDSLCHPDTSAVAITNPAFNQSAFSWASINDQTFANTSAPIAVTTVSLSPQPMCDACPVPAVTPVFAVTDSVCVNSPVKITNTTVGASSYYWSFCTADINQPPVGTNLGNVGGTFQGPVYVDYVLANGNFYGFVTNNYSGRLTRLDFGNSLLNTPAATDLGNLGGAIPQNTEGVQIVQNNGNWYVLVVGGDPGGGVTSSIVTVQLGANIANNSPTATNWGHIGNLAYPHDLYVFQDNGHWYGITVNTANNTVTRFDFGTSFTTTPTAVNLGNIGSLNGPTGVHAIKDDNGKWHVFIANALSSTLSRLDFGTSLLNTPTGVNLGNPNNTFKTCWDIYVLKYCGNSLAYVINSTDGTLVKLDFNGSLLNTPTAVNFGNLGNLNFPHCLSKIFRVGADVFSLIANVNSNSLTRLEFPGCTNSSIPNSTAQNPPNVSYSTPGVYNINLTVDDGLPTQNSLCQQVVVLGPPTLKVNNDTTICAGDTLHLIASGAASYQWSPTAGLSYPDSSNTLAKPTATTKFYVTGKNVIGCPAVDSVKVTVSPLPVISTIADTAVCSGASIQLTTTFINGDGYKWSPGFGLSDSTTASPTASPLVTTKYNVRVTDKNGCSDKDSVTITILHQPTVKSIADTSICSGNTIQLSTTAVNGTKYSWSPSKGLSDSSLLSPSASPLSSTSYIITVNPGSQCFAKDTVNITVNPSPTVNASGDTSICAGSSARLVATATGNVSYAWSPKTGLGDSTIYNPVASPTATTKYFITVTSTNNCTAKDSTTLTVLPQPTVKSIADTSICSGTAIQLSTTAVNGTKYSWSPSKGLSDSSLLSPSASPLSTTSYIITINLGSQCFAKDTVNITVNPSPTVKASGDTSICAGSTAQLVATATGNVSYAWSPKAGLSDSSIYNPVASPTATTKYFITVTSANNCMAKDSTTLSVLPQPTVKSIPDTSICSGTPILLSTTAVNGTKYSWSPSKGLSDSSLLSPSASPLSSTSYIITVNPGSQCFAKDTVNITVNPSPTVNASGDTSICAGSSVRLVATATGNVSYAWSPKTGLGDSTIYNPLASPTATTKYFITVTSANNCTAKDSTTLSVLPQPTVKSIADTSICSGTTIQLATTAVNGSSYNWSPATGLSSATVPSPSAKPLVNTSYIITVNPGSQCFATDTVNITVKPLPVLAVSADTLICIGGSAQLSASSPSAVTYAWSPPAGLTGTSISNPVASPSSTTTYSITISDNNQCSTSGSVTVMVVPQPVFAVNPPSATICIGNSLPVNATGGDKYQWYPTTGVANPIAASTTVSPQATTTYFVVISNSTCRVADTLQTVVNVTTKPDITIGKSNDLDCFKSQARLYATGGNQYIWSPAATLDNPYTASPVASPFQTTTYYVEVRKGVGCAAVDSIQVRVLTDMQNSYLLPSAFTPNGDGANDCFGVKLWGGIKTIDFSVYDRWGVRVFHTNNPNDCWDGNYNGQRQAPGAYVYQIQANTVCGQVYRKGTVVLVR